MTYNLEYSTCVKMTIGALAALFTVIALFSCPQQKPKLALAQPATIVAELGVTPTPSLKPSRRAPEDYAFVVSPKQAICLAKTIDGEAANQHESGQIRVAETVMNRYRNGYWGDTICDVVHYKKAGVYHFSMYDPKDPNLKRVTSNFSGRNLFSPDTMQAIWVADQVLMYGVRYLPEDSYNYATASVDNYWTRKLSFVEQDGDHVFRRGW